MFGKHGIFPRSLNVLDDIPRMDTCHGALMSFHPEASLSVHESFLSLCLELRSFLTRLKIHMAGENLSGSNYLTVSRFTRCF